MFHPRGPTFLELARQCLSSTERGYDLLAPKFDYTPFRTPDEVLLPARDRLAALWKGSPPIESALDICCGTGAAMQAFSPLVRSRFVGLDFSQGMLDRAHERLGDSPVIGPAYELVRGDALAMPWENVFDLATCFGALGHILPADEPAFVAQVFRVMRTGGRFVFVTAESPSIASRSYWLSHGFNAVMRLRNAIWRPKFIMYYLTFLLPRAARLLEAAGFEVQTPQCDFPRPFQSLKLVVATKASAASGASRS